MAMTNESMTPTPVLSGEQLLKVAAAAKAQAARPQSEAELLDSLSKDSEAEDAAAIAEANATAQVKTGGVKQKAIAELCEDDAYNLDISMSAPSNYSPDFLKAELSDGNYIGRWCNRNSVRQAQLSAQGFRVVKEEDVVNKDNLEMFIDAQGHYVYSDLILMKIPRNIYYGRIRHAYVKSLQASSSRKASKAGADFAKDNLIHNLKPGEREYLDRQQKQSNKEVYSPTVGV